MTKSFKVEVNPEVLKWLIESSGWGLEELSKRMNLSVDTLLEFESGKKQPTLSELKKMSSLFKRPLALFLLSKPRKEKPLPKDYRFLPNRNSIFNRKTLLAIRKARSLQEISKELSLNIKYETAAMVQKATLSDDPSEIAKKHRELFRLDILKQKNFKDAYKFFNYLRDALEDLNILVFQFSMPIEDARGFVLADDLPFVIVINSKDSIEARIFTMMHEFGHILLRETVIDIPEDSLTNQNDVEMWCNRFASAFLLPKENAIELFEEYKSKLTESETLGYLSRKYKISKALLLVNMLELNFISKIEFKQVLSRYAPNNESNMQKRKRKVMRLRSDQRCLFEMGNKFVSLVANNFDKDYITYSDALSYLSIKSKDFERVLTEARK